MASARLPHIGITIGDPAGIGPEVILKSLRNQAVRRSARLTLIGHKAVFRGYRFPHHKNITCLDCGSPADYAFRPGKPDRTGAAISLQCLDLAMKLLKSGELNGLVTAPVSKEAISELGTKFTGHTEFIANRFQVKNYEMMFVTPVMKVVVATRHVPLGQVPGLITASGLRATFRVTSNALKKLFRIKHPRIAVCGLNPHAGEGGKIGKEELTTVIPAIKATRKSGIDLYGPFPADTLFHSERIKRFDAIIAMYHDQGLIPVKSMFFNRLVNLTIGLPFIRTSPAHGTAFDLAGTGKADPGSMIEAVKLAVKLSSPLK